MADPDPSSPETGLIIDVEVESSRWSDTLEHPEEVCRAAAASALAGVDDAPEIPALSVLLSDDETIAGLNSQFRGKDVPTNVLSFPAGDTYPDGTVMLGDIAVAHETVAREAADAGIAIEDHLRHMIVHGTLHLLGFDHQDDDEAQTMETLEVQVLATMGVANPYADAPLEAEQ